MSKLPPVGLAVTIIDVWANYPRLTTCLGHVSTRDESLALATVTVVAHTGQHVIGAYDEGIRWVRGHLSHESEEAQALLASFTLVYLSG